MEAKPLSFLRAYLKQQAIEADKVEVVDYALSQTSASQSVRACAKYVRFLSHFGARKFKKEYS